MSAAAAPPGGRPGNQRPADGQSDGIVACAARRAAGQPADGQSDGIVASESGVTGAGGRRRVAVQARTSPARRVY